MSPQSSVAPRSGALQFAVTDLIVPAGPISLEVGRTLQGYTTGYEAWVGNRWRLNWEVGLTHAGPLATIRESGGETIFRFQQTDNQYVSAAGDRLWFKNNQAICTKQDGSALQFDSQGRLIDRVDRNGNRIKLSYGPDLHVSRVEGPYGSFLKFTTDVHGRLAAVEGSNGGRVRYFYGIDSTETTTAGTTAYDYGVDGSLVRTRHPFIGVTEFSYSTKKRVHEIRTNGILTERFELDDSLRRLVHTDAQGQMNTTQWSADGKKEEITDTQGGKTVIEYNAEGRIFQVTGSTGTIVRYRYDSAGRMIAIEDDRGKGTRLEYLENSELVAARIDESGSKLEYGYDDHGNLIEVRGGKEILSRISYYPDGLIKSKRGLGRPEIKYEYDRSGRLSALSDTQGGMTRFEYDERGNLVRTTNPLGKSTSWTYDSANRTISQTDAVGATTRFQYHLNGRIAGVEDPRGGTTKFAYDKLGQLLNVTDPERKITSYEYDAQGRVRKLSLPDGRTETYRHDSAGNLVEISNSSGAVWRYTYDRAGRMTSETGPLGYKRTAQYDAAGRLLEAKDALGRTKAYKYTSEGRLAAIRAPNGTEQRIEYGPDGRILSASESTQRRLKLEYDETGRVKGMARTANSLMKIEYQVGRVTRVEGPAGGSISYEINESGRRSGQKYSNGEKFQFSYDRLGQITEGTDGLGRAWKMAYSPRGELVSLTSPGGVRFRYSYNAIGQIENVIDPLGRIRHYEYDGLGRRIQEADPLGRESVVRYGPDSRIYEIKLPDGQVTRLKYDLLGRMTELQTTDSPTAYLEYDAVGNVVSEKCGQFVAQYRYDEHDQVSEASYQPSGKTVRYSYDENGRRTGMGVEGVGQWSYEYDDQDRVVSVKDSQERITRYLYDDAGRVVRQIFPNGLIQQRSYDGRGRTLTLAVLNAKGNKVISRQYRYDQAGALVTESRENGIDSKYEYDVDDRLIRAVREKTAQEFSYDTAGNRMLDGDRAEYDLADQLVKYDGETFKYDAQGRMVLREKEGARTEYQYGPNGRLTQVKTNGRVVAEYGYDARGRRVWKKADGRVTHFVFDGSQVLLELDDVLAVDRVWTQGVELDRPIGSVQGSSVSYYLADLRGSVIATADRNGELTQQWDYDPYGNLQSGMTRMASPMPFGFTGAQFDAETGLYSMRARYYDPRLGRFLTPDPVSGKPSNPATLHPYLYAQNNPFRFRDRFGTTAEDIANGIDGISGGIGQSIGQGIGEGVGGVLGAIDAMNTDLYRQRDPTFPGLTQEQRNAAATNLGQVFGEAGNLGGRLVTGVVSEPLRFGTGLGTASVEAQQGNYGSAVLHSGLDVLRGFTLGKVAVGGGSAAINLNRTLHAPAGVPSGPLSTSMRGAFIAEAESSGFQRWADLYARMHGQKIDWTEFMANVRGASYREMTLGQIMRTGGGFAGAPAEGASGWLLSAAEGLGNIPGIGPLLKSQAIRHELMHAVQDTLWNVFRREHELGGLLGRSIYELVPSALGDPLIKAPLIATTAIPMAGAYFGPKILDSLEGKGQGGADQSILNQLGKGLSADPRLFDPSNAALVPNLFGQTEGAAQQLIGEKFQFVPVPGRPADPSKGQVEGTAHFQMPSPNRMYPLNSPVIVGFYTKGTPDMVVDVPPVVGLTEEAALAKLAEVRLKGTVEHAEQSPPKKEMEFKVKSQSPGGYAKATPGSTVTLVIHPKFEKPGMDSPMGDGGQWYVVRMATWKSGDPEGRLYLEPVGEDAGKISVPISEKYAEDVKRMFGVEKQFTFHATRKNNTFTIDLNPFAEKAAKAIKAEAAKKRDSSSENSILGFFGVSGGEPEDVDIRFGPSEVQIWKDGMVLRIFFKSRMIFSSSKGGKLDLPLNAILVGRPE